MAVLTLDQTVSVPWWQASEQRFKNILRKTTIAFVLLFIVFPLLPLPELDRKQQETVPPRIAKVILQKRQAPPAPKPKPPKAEPKKQEVKKEKIDKKPVDKKPSKQQIRKKVSKIGLLAMKSELDALRDLPDVDRLLNTQSKAIRQQDLNKKRELGMSLSRNVAPQTATVNTSSLSKTSEDISLSTRSVSQVEASGDFDNQQIVDGERNAHIRSFDEIKTILARYKKSLELLYRRELRKRPGLAGKVSFEITIAPSGEVSDIKIVESQLNAPALERRLLVKLRSIDFGARDVESIVYPYSPNFVP